MRKVVAVGMDMQGVVVGGEVGVGLVSVGVAVLVRATVVAAGLGAGVVEAGMRPAPPVVAAAVVELNPSFLTEDL